MFLDHSTYSVKKKPEPKKEEKVEEKKSDLPKEEET